MSCLGPSIQASLILITLMSHESTFIAKRKFFNERLAFVCRYKHKYLDCGLSPMSIQLSSSSEFPFRATIFPASMFDLHWPNHRRFSGNTVFCSPFTHPDYVVRMLAVWLPVSDSVDFIFSCRSHFSILKLFQVPGFYRPRHIFSPLKAALTLI